MGTISAFPTTATLTDVVHTRIPSALNQQYQQCEDNISTDSSSIDGDTKKQKRKLFSFGKKSGKTKSKNV
jgi:hypothetical protein